MVKATWERTSSHTARYEIEIPVEVMEEALQKAYRKLVTRVNIPGFRKGKAPRAILERAIGRQALLEEAVEMAVPDAYNEAVEQSGLEPIAQPEIDVKTMDDGQPLVFTADVAVKPEVKLGQTEGLEIERDDATVPPGEVDHQLQHLAENHAQLVPKDGPAANGDVVSIDFEGFLGDDPFAGGKAENYDLELGSGSFIPGFEEQLVGAAAGDERDVRVTFPADYGAAHLAGQEALFKVKVHGVKRREIPAIDDDLAKATGSYETLQELRQALENRLAQAAEEAAQRAYEARVVEAVVAQAEVEPPELLVQRRTESMIRDLADRLRYQGLDLESQLEAEGKTRAELEQDFAAAAAQSVKTDLVLEAVAKQAGLSVSDSDITAEAERLARPYGKQAGAMRRLLLQPDNRSALRESLLRRKAQEYLVERQQPVPRQNAENADEANTSPAAASAAEAGASDANASEAQE